MNDEIYSDMAIERAIADKFGVRASIEQAIARNVPVSRTTNATVFLTEKKQLYVYITGQAKLSLGDVQKIVTRMGLKAELFLPPKHRPDYFDAIGREKIEKVFPGRHTVSEDDLRFYRTLATYNPALVLLSEVRDGQIYQHDADASGSWRPCVKFTYRRIKTS